MRPSPSWGRVRGQGGQTKPPDRPLARYRAGAPEPPRPPGRPRGRRWRPQRQPPVTALVPSGTCSPAVRREPRPPGSGPIHGSTSDAPPSRSHRHPAHRTGLMLREHVYVVLSTIHGSRVRTQSCPTCKERCYKSQSSLERTSEHLRERGQAVTRPQATGAAGRCCPARGRAPPAAGATLVRNSGPVVERLGGQTAQGGAVGLRARPADPHRASPPAVAPGPSPHDAATVGARHARQCPTKSSAEGDGRIRRGERWRRTFPSRTHGTPPHVCATPFASPPGACRRPSCSPQTSPCGPHLEPEACRRERPAGRPVLKGSSLAHPAERSRRGRRECQGY